MTCQLYRHFDRKGRLLYIGVSFNTLIRLSQHRTAAPWFEDIVRVEIENYPTRLAAIWAEEKAIRCEKPLHNVVHAARPKERPKFEIVRLRTGPIVARWIGVVHSRDRWGDLTVRYGPAEKDVWVGKDVSTWPATAEEVIEFLRDLPEWAVAYLPPDYENPLGPEFMS